jgi:BMFP domain-containing protein YqiC
MKTVIIIHSLIGTMVLEPSNSDALEKVAAAVTEALTKAIKSSQENLESNSKSGVKNTIDPSRNPACNQCSSNRSQCCRVEKTVTVNLEKFIGKIELAPSDNERNYIKKLLAPVIREVLKEETSPYKGMTKEEVETWFREMMQRVVLNSEQL